MNPGIYHDITNEAYHSGPGISKSDLGKIDRAPACYLAKVITEPTPSMLAGTLAHCAILEPAEFDKRYIVRPDGLDLRTKDGKAWAASVPPDLTIITPDQKAKAFAQADALRAIPDIAEALSRGRPEVSAYWIDEETGVLCKCRPDWVHDVDDDSVILVDIKTTASASPKDFPRSVANYGYAGQAAWYSDGYAAASGKKVIAFILAVAEQDAPFLAAAYLLDEDALYFGREWCRRNLNRYAQCLQSNTWPGYSTAIETIGLPAWAVAANQGAIE